IVVPDAPEKEGYSFDGWTPAVAETVPANDVTYTASFKINQYTVTFKSDDEVVKSETLDYGTTITVPVAPTKEGYTFTGWEGYTDGVTVPAEDVTYTATWTINQYTVTFIVDGDILKTETLDYGSPIVAPDVPDKVGYTFDSWTPAVAETVPAEDVTYVASWSTNKYIVAFVVDGETVKSESLEYGTTIVLPDAPIKDGYTFAGWSGYIDGATVPTEDVTYTASWTINKYTVAFVVDGETIKSETLEYGAPIVAPTDLTKEGYVLSAWSPEVAETVPANDVTYTATWVVSVGIETVSLSDAKDGEYYTLQGVKIARPTKAGIYVHNGRKVALK
ncbi:MAG: InlB B-repeat-containing protein, partial [Bacteroidaceae bacterium]|nr:InlB B-repeat-containing protein [Bacteroidaceae bacterium]